MPKINIITLGCSKNTVDSENIATQLKAHGIEFVFDLYDTTAKTVVINTCGFISDAKEESINTILEFAKAKENNEIDNLYVIGCLSERYKNDLRDEISEVDQFFGVNDIEVIVETLQAKYKNELIGERVISTPKHYAYLKISEGCDRKCSFCAIPLIRGKHKSIPKELLIEQAGNLVENGVKELILIAQDLSYYGIDIYKIQALPELLEELSDIPGLKWIRLHYAYPANFPKRVIDLIKEKNNICKYIDIPFQHISSDILKKMRRGHDKEVIINLIKTLKEKIPEIAIRTTMLVGHSGENDIHFNELKDFVKQYELERLGVFTYSEEEDTYSAENFADNVPGDIKKARADEIMEIQQEISYNLNQQKVGKVYEVIIDREEKDYFVGRTEFDSPEVDNEVYVLKDKNLKIGNFYNVFVTKAEDFDLFGKVT